MQCLLMIKLFTYGKYKVESLLEQGRVVSLCFLFYSRWVNNDSFSKKMTDAAHQKFIENYEYEVSMKKFLNMYKSITIDT